MNAPESTASSNAASTQPGPSPAPLLEVRNLRTEFATSRGTVHAVNDVSFNVSRGDLVGIVGETGCGKSVTIRSLIGLIRPPGRVVGGQVLFEGTDLRTLGQRRMREIRGARIGFVPQNPFGSLNPVLRISRQFRNVIRAHRDATREECYERTLQMLKAVGIADPERVANGYPHELSGGMAQRTVIAMALIADPPLVIADEPTTGLDVTVQRQILDLIHDLLADGSRSMLLVTHDLGIVAQYCQKVVVMYAGQVVESGPVRSVFRNPAHPYTEALLGAIPRPGEPLVTLRGTVPDLVNYPSGCAFYERCSRRHDARCATQRPPLAEIAPGHLAATFCSTAQPAAAEPAAQPAEVR